MEHKNMANIVALILLRSSNDTESTVMSLLNAATPDFNNVDCAELVKTEPVLIASELLKATSELDDLRTSNVS